MRILLALSLLVIQHSLSCQTWKYWGASRHVDADETTYSFSINDADMSVEVYNSYYHPDGIQPENVTLCKASDGKLYGVLSEGHYIFSYDPASEEYSSQELFTEDWAGGIRGGFTEGPTGRLFCLAWFGSKIYTGALFDPGMAFEYDIEDQSSRMVVDFGDYFIDGYGPRRPEGNFLYADNGKLYAFGYRGGDSDAGVFFEMDPNTGECTTIKECGLYTIGKWPSGTPFQASSGKIYGGHNYFFEYDPVSKNFEQIQSFEDLFGNQWLCTDHFVEDSEGAIYGIVNSGTSFPQTLFKFDPTTRETTIVHELTEADGYQSYGGLMKASNGKFYATTTKGGDYGRGTIIEFDPAQNTFIVKHHFYYGYEGFLSTGTLTEGLPGKLYGLTSYGGLHHSGVGEPGTLFEFDLNNNQFKTKVHFDYFTDAEPKLTHPVLHPNGKLYSTSKKIDNLASGGLNEIDVNQNKLNTVYHFTARNSGCYPDGWLTVGSDNKIYGFTFEGGASHLGTIYSYDPDSAMLEVECHFDTLGIGNNPIGQLCEVSDGVYLCNVNNNAVEEGMQTSGIILLDTKNDTCYNVPIENPAERWWFNGGMFKASDGYFYSIVRHSDLYYLYKYDHSSGQFTIAHTFDEKHSLPSPMKFVEGEVGLLYGTLTENNPEGDNTFYLYSFNIYSKKFTLETDLPYRPSHVQMAEDKKLIYFSAAYHIYEVDPITKAVDVREIPIQDIDPSYEKSGRYSSYAGQYLRVQSCMDLSVRLQGVQLVAESSQEAISYQWFDCETDTPIEGATSATYFPEENGHYSVEVSSDSCTVRSACKEAYIIGKESVSTSAFSIFPNPTQSIVQIHSSLPNYTVEVFDMHGLRVREQEVSNGTTSLDLSEMPKGMYLIKTTHELHSQFSKVFLQ